VTSQTKKEWRITNMKTLGLFVLALAVVLSFTTHSFAQAPMATPTPAMPGKGKMKGEMKEGEKDTMKRSDGMMEKKADTMMEKTTDGMKKESAGMMEKKQP
jgi:hypothetical protein